MKWIITKKKGKTLENYGCYQRMVPKPNPVSQGIRIRQDYDHLII